jgi:hypothetical protein
MSKIWNLLFNGKEPVPVGPATITPGVAEQRELLNKEIESISESYKIIAKEGRRMKKRIDAALAIAKTTGGLSGR